MRVRNTRRRRSRTKCTQTIFEHSLGTRYYIYFFVRLLMVPINNFAAENIQTA